MCLILFANRIHQKHKLLLVANRDEFYVRPTRPLGFWRDQEYILAGRDLKAGGTWLGVTRSGRFAAITNYRNPAALKANTPSRGALIHAFLSTDISIDDYLNSIKIDAHRYNGFNLLVGDTEQICYYSNQMNTVTVLHPGLYGMSNHLLDTAWPKVERGKRGLNELIERKNDIPMESLFKLLSDRTAPSLENLPDTGVGKRWEKLLAPMFIRSRGYGTRSSSVLIMSYSNRITVAEKTFCNSCLRPSKSRTRIFQFNAV